MSSNCSTTLHRPLTKFFSRPKLESLADRTANIPVVNLFSALVKDWIPLIDEYYYCM